MGDESDDGERGHPDDPGFPRVPASIWSVSLDGDWTANGGVPPWRFLTPKDVGKSAQAYREASVVTDAFRESLQAAGFTSGDVPELCASVDAQGRAVMFLGTVSLSAARRLRRFLDVRGR